MNNSNSILGVPSTDILKNWASTYVAVYFFNLTDDTFVSISNSKAFGDAVANTTSAQEATNIMVNMLMRPDFMDEANTFYDLSTLPERLRDKDCVSIDYEGSLKGWCRGTFVATSRDENGNVTSVLYVVRYIDDEKTKEESQYNVIDALSRNFLNVYLVNPYKSIGRTIKLEGYITAGINDHPDKPFNYFEMLSVYIDARVCEEDKERLAKAFKPEVMIKNLESEDEYNIQYRINGEDNEAHYYQCRILRTEQKDWCIVAFQNIDKVVSEEQKRADELQNALELANRASRSKTDFLSRMSHDMRTPMNGIAGMTKMALENLENTDKVKGYLENVQRASRQLEALINDVLEMSRLERGRIDLTEETVNLKEIIENDLPALEVLASENVVKLSKINYDIVHSCVITSPVHFQEIIMNLYTNAIKYNKPDGRVNLKVWEEEVDDKTSNFHFYFKDTGMGMSEEFKNRLFEPFSREIDRIPEGTNGTGLGMSIIKEIIDLMHGTIQVDSTENVGTTIEVMLPLVLGQEEVVEQVESVEDAAKGLKILVAEDNKLNAEILKYMLEGNGAKIRLAKNGEEAVELFANSKQDEFDLILMDVKMPKMDGMQATRMIRALEREDAKKIPIIATTANAFLEDKKACLEAGMNDHIAKPVDWDEVLQKINQYLN